MINREAGRPKSLKLLVIDLDGTLVDSAPDLTVAVNAALKALSLPVADEPSVRDWIGDGVDVLLERALEAEGGDRIAQLPAARAVFADTYAKHLFDRSRLYDGVPETLAALGDLGLHLACVTNKREVFARAVLDQAGIIDAFELVIGGDTLPFRKPDPLPLTTAAQHFSVTPEQSAMVGDSHHDLSAADAAGFSFFWARYGYCADPGPMDPQRCRRIDGFSELLGFLSA